MLLWMCWFWLNVGMVRCVSWWLRMRLCCVRVCSWCFGRGSWLIVRVVLLMLCVIGVVIRILFCSGWCGC